MGKKKIVVVPKKSKINVGDYIIFDRLDGVGSYLDLSQFHEVRNGKKKKV